MASRRLRTKAVINLPVRRGRDVKDEPSKPDDKSKEPNEPEVCKPSSLPTETANDNTETNAPQDSDKVTTPERTVTKNLAVPPAVTVRKRLKPLVNIPARKERLNVPDDLDESNTKDGRATLRSPKNAATMDSITQEKQVPQVPLEVETASLDDADNTPSLTESSQQDNVTVDEPDLQDSTPNNVIENDLTTTSSQPRSSVRTGNGKDLSEPDSVQQAKTPEKRTTHRRIRKNGVVEMLTKARRDFQNKFGNKTPDKKKLTMFDLIFYNPSTNPMKVSEHEQVNPSVGTASKCGDEIAERLAEESVDDLNPSEQTEDDVVAMPAPQVKVGPDGSLIIDEQSLVIETTGSRQRKDELANSVVVMDYGVGNTTYSSFSNKRKGKEWPKEETLKFYRALHSVGTDFQLMQSIFPKRTRRDLKLKFKKEDRSNRELIDKALRFPLEFDLTSMEKDLEQEEKENEEKLVQELERKEKQKQIELIKKRKGKAIKGFLGQSLNLEDRNETRAKKPPRKRAKSDEASEPSRKRKKETSKRKPGKTTEKWLSSSSSEEEVDALLVEEETKTQEEEIGRDLVIVDVAETVVSTTDTGVTTLATTVAGGLSTSHDVEVSSSDDEQVFLKTTRQTRYGRIPQRRVLSSDESEEEVTPHTSLPDQTGVLSSDESEEEVTPHTSLPDQTGVLSSDESEEEVTPHTSLPDQTGLPLNITDLSSVEPGSIVIFSTPGLNNYKLFMVGPKGSTSLDDAIAMTVHPNILATMTESMEPQPMS